MSTNNSSVSAQQLAEQEQEHLFLHYESHNGGGHHGDLPAHLLPGHVTPEPQDLENHGSGSGSSKDAKRNGHGRIFRFFVNLRFSQVSDVDFAKSMTFRFHEFQAFFCHFEFLFFFNI